MGLIIIINMISSVLFSGLEKGFGINVVRNALADVLKDGDVSFEKWRKKLICELHDVNTKIDALVRKDLLVSRSSLKMGIGALVRKLEKANGHHDIENKTTTATQTKQIKSGELNVAIALSTDIERLKDTFENSPFASAEKHFRHAGKKAAEAFWNEALDLPNRIVAAKIRVVSKILECLQDTDEAVVGCMLFLEELHNLPAIKETFSTYFQGGIKSWFYNDYRLEIIKPVIRLNFAVLEFVAKFSGEMTSETSETGP
ncbi:Hypothetical predicted protein [Paramuricea clavata]|uniref:Uncharacterized protein n=1 Tax=Paramuricea clavata TaxID=317549 RepID=A0A6S7J068_PARCT|nr:Hypothetical predicted protein [Paramuricea clavata]